MRTIIENDGEVLIEHAVNADKRLKMTSYGYTWGEVLFVSTHGNFVYAETWEGFPPREVKFLCLPLREEEK